MKKVDKKKDLFYEKYYLSKSFAKLKHHFESFLYLFDNFLALFCLCWKFANKYRIYVVCSKSIKTIAEKEINYE